MKKQRLYIISLDAFGAKDLAYARTLPTFKYLLDRSALVEKVESIYPSLTYMAHTTIVTGVYPRKHGITNNTYIQPERKSPDWHWYAKDIKVPTLFDIAHEAGYSIASFLWPVTGRSRVINYNFAEVFANRPWQSQSLITLWSSSPKFIFDLERKFGKIRKGIKQPALDHFLTAGVVDTIHSKNPDLMAIHLVDLDSTRHRFGVDTKETRAAIKQMDEHLNQIITAMKEKGIFEETVLAVFGDHYQLDAHTVVRLNQLFKTQGWLSENKDGTIQEWDVLAKGADGSCYIYTKPEVKLADVKNILERYPEQIETIYTQEEAASLGADDTCSFLVEAKRGYYFVSGSDGPFLEEIGVDGKSAFHKGVHGYSPKKESYETTLFISGPGINANACIPSARLIDEGPTFLHAIGLEFPTEVDGEVLEILFEQEGCQ
ncbi:ectonucleotide pyrophosphatase/phosphodiesterase [Carnobacterium sp. ISL-102]|uniref:alkaline phosphatase family protein n=1 Tax=Carnobacterium sp. ISL-102 TaxID=2819142 RepID=UPI001BEB7609|nr:ectonucleotide pyrophosphatase/phosphodiesterase [Carnobacterium sp. ISL-102]MBT2732138.1 alkaline phosphatase family protein [Carnobacterium sp. ISL-102]